MVIFSCYKMYKLYISYKSILLLSLHNSSNMYILSCFKKIQIQKVIITTSSMVNLVCFRK